MAPNRAGTVQLETIRHTKWRRFIHACLTVIHPARKCKGWGRLGKNAISRFPCNRKLFSSVSAAIPEVNDCNFHHLPVKKTENRTFQWRRKDPSTVILGYLHNRGVLYHQTLKKILLKFLLNRAVCRYRCKLSDRFPSQDSTLEEHERWPGITNPISNGIGQQKVSSP